MAIIDLDLYDIEVGDIDVEISEYLDEVSIPDLISELSRRKNIPAKLKDFFNSEIQWSKTPTRDAIICFLDLHISANLEDIQEKIKEIYNK